MKILIIEDEKALQESILKYLEHQGFICETVGDFLTGKEKVIQFVYDCIVIDIGLPYGSGLDIVRELKYMESKAGVIIISAKNALEDKLNGLDLGADDYLTKPFNLEELLLRVEKLIQKNKKIQVKETIGDTYEFGGNKIDFKAQEAITWNGSKVDLSKKEAMLLKLLIENRNEVVTREKILQMVWGYNVYPTTRTIDNFILSFRKYFEEDSRSPKHFHSVRSMGYKYTN